MPGLRFNKLNPWSSLTPSVVETAPPWSWKDDPVTTGMKIYAEHVQEMRNRIKNDLVYCACTCECTCTCQCQCQCQCQCTCTCTCTCDWTF